MLHTESSPLLNQRSRFVKKHFVWEELFVLFATTDCPIVLRTTPVLASVVHTVTCVYIDEINTVKPTLLQDESKRQKQFCESW